MGNLNHFLSFCRINRYKKKQITFSRLITIKPVRKQILSAVNENDLNEVVDKNDKNESVDDEKQKQQNDQSYYDRNKWKSAVQSLCPSAKSIFIYFMDGYQIMALAIGDFDSVLNEPAAAEVKLDEVIIWRRFEHLMWQMICFHQLHAQVE